MKLAHTITLSVFIRPGEPEDAIKKAMLSLVPLDLAKEKIKLVRTIAKANLTGQRDIVIYELVLEKERHTKKFLEFINAKLSALQKRELIEQDNRVDEDCLFYMRLDKKKLIDGEHVLTDSGDCFHIKMSVAAFPKHRSEALAVVKKIFG